MFQNRSTFNPRRSRYALRSASDFCPSSVAWESPSSSTTSDRAVAIEDVRAEWVLAAELERREAAVADDAPEVLFGWGGSFPHLPGEVAEALVVFAHG
jgi:hypothetical protein